MCRAGIAGDYKKFPALGRFEWEIYRPDEWKPEYKNPAFQKRLPDDTYWGAKKVMAFSDDDIRAIVELAQYSDPEAEQWLVTCLQKRRDKIGMEYFRRVLPLDDFGGARRPPRVRPPRRKLRLVRCAGDRRHVVALRQRLRDA